MDLSVPINSPEQDAGFTGCEKNLYPSNVLKGHGFIRAAQLA
jgi:hypothetical protein